MTAMPEIRVPAPGQHDARGPEESQLLEDVPWRIGRKVGRNLYAMTGPEPDDNDTEIGQLDSAQLAGAAAGAHNQILLLGAYLLEKWPEEIHEGGAADVAIALIEELARHLPTADPYGQSP